MTAELIKLPEKTTPPPLRPYTVEVAFDGGMVRWPTLATSARDAVRDVMRVERVPDAAVRAVFEWPGCDYCDRFAQLFVRDGGMTPVCRRCALDHYGTATHVKQETGELTPGTLLRLPVDTWRVHADGADHG